MSVMERTKVAADTSRGARSPSPAISAIQASTPGSSKHRKARSSSESLRMSDGAVGSKSVKQPQGIRIFSNTLQEDDETDRPPATPRDQIEEIEEPKADGEKTTESGRIRRRKSVNMGSPLPTSQTQASFFYDFIGVIGEGKTSYVYLGVHKRTGEKVAIKVIDKRRIISNRELAAEVGVLKRLTHPNIVGLKDVFITAEHLQIVMELCEGHELFDEIVDRRNFSEVDARDLIKSILLPLSYLHSKGIAHRDLKPENIMFVNENDIKQIKVVDFGFAKTIDEKQPDISMVGTLGYKAPEIFNMEPYTTQCDMWSLGVISYIVLCGFPPFFSQEYYKEDDMLNNAPFWYFFNDETDTLIEQIKLGNISFPESHWKKISKSAKDFVQSLLIVDVQKRSTAAQALLHPWITTWSPEMESQNLSNSDTSFGSVSSESLESSGMSLPVPLALQKIQKVHSRRRSGSFAQAPSESTKFLIEKHIFGNGVASSFGSPVASHIGETDSPKDPSDEISLSMSSGSLMGTKIRLLASKETQESQAAMLKALDPAKLKEYLAKRRGSLDSRTARPRPKHQRKPSL